MEILEVVLKYLTLNLNKWSNKTNKIKIIL